MQFHFKWGDCFSLGVAAEPAEPGGELLPLPNDVPGAPAVLAGHQQLRAESLPGAALLQPEDGQLPKQQLGQKQPPEQQRELPERGHRRLTAASSPKP